MACVDRYQDSPRLLLVLRSFGITTSTLYKTQNKDRRTFEFTISLLPLLAKSDRQVLASTDEFIEYEMSKLQLDTIYWYLQDSPQAQNSIRTSMSVLAHLASKQRPLILLEAESRITRKSVKSFYQFYHRRRTGTLLHA